MFVTNLLNKLLAVCYFFKIITTEQAAAASLHLGSSSDTRRIESSTNFDRFVGKVLRTIQNQKAVLSNFLICLGILPVHLNYFPGKMSAPEAFVSFSGQLVECNETFALICDFNEKHADTLNLTDLSKFENPTQMMESLYLLSILDDSQHWKVTLGRQNRIFHNLEYELIVRRSDRKINGENVLIATIKETDYSEQRKSRAASFCVPNHFNSFHCGSASGGGGRDSYSVLHPSHSGSDISVSNGGTPVRESVTSSNITHNISYNVLIVDDSATALKMMNRMVSRLGHIVTTATDGAEALAMLKTNDFDIVLMDINMPNLNGLEASHHFRKMEAQNRNEATRRGDRYYKPHLKLIAVSGEISPTIFYEVMNAGFDGFLPKPLNEESFVELLHTIEKKK